MAQRFLPNLGLRGTASYTYFELSMAQGPVGIGVTGENRLIDFIGYAWLLVMTEDRNLHLYRQTATVGEWLEVTTDLPPVFDAPLPDGARRVTFAFDQSARVIVAYELAEMLYLTRWDTALEDYVQNVTVSGVDPVVVFDATWAYDVNVSDVLMFYLDAATRSKLVCRVQRDIYAIEYELHDYGEAVVLDRVTRLPLRYQVLAADAVGDPLASSGNRIALQSELYPYPGEDQMVAAASWTALGDYISIVINQSEDRDAVLAAAAWTAAGDYISVIINQSEDQDLLVAAATWTTVGDYISVIINQSEDQDLLEAVATWTTVGDYRLVVLNYADDQDAVVAAATWTAEGNYAAA